MWDILTLVLGQKPEMTLVLWAALSLPEAGREGCLAVSPSLNEQFCLESPHKDIIKSKKHLDSSCMGQLDEPAHSNPQPPPRPVFCQESYKKLLGLVVLHLLLSSQSLLNSPPLSPWTPSFGFVRQRTWKLPAQGCFGGYRFVWNPNTPSYA